MTKIQANSGFDIEEMAPAVAAAVEELGRAIEDEIGAMLAETARMFEPEESE